MHITSTQYKGLTIEAVSYDGIGIVSFSFFVKADGFKAEGYATLNTAKGAITKHLQAAQTPDNEFVKSVINLKTQAATSDDRATASVKLEAFRDSHRTVQEDASQARIDGMVTALKASPEKWTKHRNDKGHLIHANPKMAAVYASLDYLGVAKERDTRSRNKREGRYAGKHGGKHYRSYRAAMPGRDLFGRTVWNT